MPLTPIWHLRLPQYASGLELTPDGNILYLLRGGELHCVLGNRQLAWTRRVETKSVGGLLVRGNSAYVCDQDLLRIDVESGRVLARREIADELPWMYAAGAFIVLFQRSTRALSALDPETLDLLWERPDPAGTLGVRDGMLRREHEETVEIVDPATGAVRHVAFPRPLGGPPQYLHVGRTYCRFSGPERIAIDVESREVIWRHFEGVAGRHAEIQPGGLSFIPASLHVLRGHSDGIAWAGDSALSGYDLVNGRLIWRRDLGRIEGIPALAAGRIYVSTSEGTIHVVRLADGAVLASHELHRQVSQIASREDGLVAVEAFTHDRNSSELHLFEFAEDGGGGTPPGSRFPSVDPETAARIESSWPKRAGDILDEFENEHGSSGIREALGHADPYVRKHAARRCAASAPDANVASLSAALAAERDESVRREMAWALARIGSERAIAELTVAFERAIDAQDEEARSVRDYAEALASSEQAPVPSLIAALESRRYDVAEWAAEALAQLHDSRAAESLARALDADSGIVRSYAREGLVRIGGAAVPALISALTDGGPEGQAGAARVLGRLRAQEAVDPLSRAAASRDGAVRAAAAEALGRIGSSAAVPVLMRLLKDRYWTVRVNAIKALGGMRHEPAIDALLAAARDRDDDVRAAAAEALAVFGDSRAVPALVTMLGRSGPHAYAAVALAEIGPQAVPSLLPLLKERRFDTRFWAITALGWIGDPRAVPFLKKVSASEEVIRTAVARALERLS